MLCTARIWLDLRYEASSQAVQMTLSIPLRKWRSCKLRMRSPIVDVSSGGWPDDQRIGYRCTYPASI